jgi:hypothetical protein
VPFIAENFSEEFTDADFIVDDQNISHALPSNRSGKCRRRPPM